jgi:hypothetical protein
MCYLSLTTNRKLYKLWDLCKKLEKRDDVIGVVNQTKKNEDGIPECKPLWIPINGEIGQILVEVYKKDLKRTIRRLRRIKGVIDTPKRIDQIHVSFLGEQESLDINLGHR